MKVKELKELLNNFDNELDVIMSKDSEGNNYSPLSSIEEGNYEPETTWYGYVRHPDDLEVGDVNNSIVLYPIN